MKFIKDYNLIEESKQNGARKVLSAAALTYIAGFLTSILNLLYYVNILKGRRGEN
jgi:Zn-dependent membrane protease YugP